MLRKLLLLFVLSFSYLINSQTLYWVGGSGYWNDVNHWSTISGGSSAGVIPGNLTNVMFDDYSGSVNAVIHATQNVEIGSIKSTNRNFNIQLIGSPTVSFKINSGVILNEYFKFDYNGKILLTPSQPTTYQFSQTVFKGELVINSNNPIELGIINSISKITLSGNFSLKNTIAGSSDLQFLNSSAVLNNVTFNAKNSFLLTNSNVTGAASVNNRLIVPGNNLNAAQISALTGSNISIKIPIPQACNPTLVGSTNPTCQGLCNGTATINLAACSNPPYTIQWLNAGPAAPCQALPPFEPAYVSSTYSVIPFAGAVHNMPF